MFDACESDLANMRYVLFGAADNALVEGNNGTGEHAKRDEGHFGMRLQDFHQMKEASQAELTLAEVAALRLYTTSTFKLINEPLRKVHRAIPPTPM